MAGTVAARTQPARSGHHGPGLQCTLPHKQQDGNRHAGYWGHPPSLLPVAINRPLLARVLPDRSTNWAALDASAVGNESEPSRNCPALTAVVDPNEFPSPRLLVPPEFDCVQGSPPAQLDLKLPDLMVYQASAAASFGPMLFSPPFAPLVPVQWLGGHGVNPPLDLYPHRHAAGGELNGD